MSRVALQRRLKPDIFRAAIAGCEASELSDAQHQEANAIAIAISSVKLKKRRTKRAKVLRLKRATPQSIERAYISPDDAERGSSIRRFDWFGIEMYEFEVVEPRIDVLSKGLNAPFSFRIMNNSYITL